MKKIDGLDEIGKVMHRLIEKAGDYDGKFTSFGALYSIEEMPGYRARDLRVLSAINAEIPEIKRILARHNITDSEALSTIGRMITPVDHGHMNTLEGVLALEVLMKREFPNSPIAESSIDAAEYYRKSVEGKWKERFGDKFVIKPEDYAEGAILPVAPPLKLPATYTVINSLQELRDDCKEFSGDISKTVSVGKKDLQHFRNRDLIILQKTESVLKVLQTSADTKDSKDALQGIFAKHHISRMNTLEGADAIVDLFERMFPAFKGAAACTPNYNCSETERFPALWKAKFGDSIPIKPSDYAEGIIIPECKDGIEKFVTVRHIS